MKITEFLSFKYFTQVSKWDEISCVSSNTFIEKIKSNLSLVFKFSKVVVCTFYLFLLIILFLNSSVNPVKPPGSIEVTL